VVTFEPIDVKRERGGEHPRQGGAVRVYDESRRTHQMKHAQDHEQQDESGRDTRKAHQVEMAHLNLRGCFPATDRKAGDEKPGNHEEHDDGVIAGPEQHLVDGVWKRVFDIEVTEDEPQMNVMQGHQQNAQPAQDIDTVEPEARGDFDIFVAGFCHRTGAPTLGRVARLSEASGTFNVCNLCRHERVVRYLHGINSR
jgi:hypothetical protein